jgi:hypothetical protein
MDDEAHGHQTVDYLLDVGFRGPFLHHNKHEILIVAQRGFAAIGLYVILGWADHRLSWSAFGK